MRILMLAQNYPPVIGGEEQHVRNLSIALVKRGYEVAVVSLRDGISPSYTEDQGVRVYRVDGLLQRLPQVFSTDRRFAPPFPDPATTVAVRRIIRRERPDIVHAHNWMVHAFLPLKSMSSARLVLTLHDYSLVCPQKRLQYRGASGICAGPQLWKCLSCAADHYGLAKGGVTTLTNRLSGRVERSTVDMFIAVSHAVVAGNELIESGLPYRVIPNFVPDDIGVPCADLSAQSHTLLEALPTVDFMLFVGDLKRDKGVHTLLEAVSGIPQRPPLVLIGQRYQETPTELPPNVVLIPGLPHDAIMQAWQAAMLALVPSTWADPCPTVAMEALATGTPVIASRIGGLTDIVTDGDSGLLTPPGDVMALRQAIVRLLQDNVLRDRMGTAARARVKVFQASSVVPQIEQVYQELMSASSGASVPVDHGRSHQSGGDEVALERA